MGSDKSNDDPAVTEIDVEVDASMVSEITITRTGASPITAFADSASPADNEPTTLEPQLGVRGLVAPASSPPPATFAEVGTRRGSEADDEEEERTTQNIESHVLAVYERAVSAAASSAPLTQLSPIAVTPSEPIRLESSRAAIAGASQPRRPAPIPAAGRPPEPERDKDRGPVTTRRGPAKADDSSGDDDDETETDAVHSDLVAFSRAQARTVPVIKEDPGLEPEETRTVQAPLTMASEQALFIDSAAPRRERFGDDDARSELDAKASAGGTVRMFYDPAAGTATAHPESERGLRAATRPMQAFGEQPTVQALPLQQNPAMGAPAVVRNPSPASLDATHGPRRKPRRRVGRLVLVFVIAGAASGAGVHYRHRLSPWIMARLPAGWQRARTQCVGRAASVEHARAVPLPRRRRAPPPSRAPLRRASASAPVAAGAALRVRSASPGASASASAQRNSKKRFPPPKK